MSSTSHPIAIHTTRLTSPEPTGFAKTAQDDWDKLREKQVRGYEDRTGASAFRHFCAVVQRGAEVLLTKPADLDPADNKLTICCALGSYNILDGSKGKVIDKFQDDFIKLQHRKFPSAVNDFLVKHNIFVVHGGIRTTGTVHYADGTFDVVDPTKGVALDGDVRKFSSIKMIQTPYLYLAKLSPEIAAEIEKM